MRTRSSTAVSVPLAEPVTKPAAIVAAKSDVVSGRVGRGAKKIAEVPTQVTPSEDLTAEEQRIMVAIEKTNKRLEFRAELLTRVKSYQVIYVPTFFEEQEAMRCQLHAVNNAIGYKFLSVKDIEKVRTAVVKKHNQKNKGKLTHTGGPKGGWTKDILFRAVVLNGGRVRRARLGVDGSQPEKFTARLDKEGPDKTFILYVTYVTKELDKAGKATLNEVKHCVAFRDGHVLDSVLKVPVTLAAYPYLLEIITVYEVSVAKRK